MAVVSLIYYPYNILRLICIYISDAMVGTAAPTLFVDVHSPRHYFNCRSSLDQEVDQDSALAVPDHCPPTLCHLPQEEKEIGA